MFNDIRGTACPYGQPSPFAMVNLPYITNIYKSKLINF